MLQNIKLNYLLDQIGNKKSNKNNLRESINIWQYIKIKFV